MNDPIDHVLARDGRLSVGLGRLKSGAQALFVSFKTHSGSHAYIAMRSEEERAWLVAALQQAAGELED